MNIITQIWVWSTYFRAHHILDRADNSSPTWHTKDILWARIMGSLGNPAIPKNRGVRSTPRKLCWTHVT